MIKLENVHKSFGKNEVLKGIDLHIEKGQVVVIIGPSGSGKSTVLRTMNYLEEPTSGKVIVDGMDLSDKSKLNEVRAEVGMVFQKPNPFPMSIYDNIAYGPRIHGIRDKKTLDKIVEESLKGAAIWDEVKDRLKKSAIGLSGGQQQRTSIGRAIIKNPDLLLCDEPTGALDYHTSKDILQLIEDVNKKYGNTTIIVTHNDAIKDMADRVIYLHDGRIRENIKNTHKIPAKGLNW